MAWDAAELAADATGWIPAVGARDEALEAFSRRGGLAVVDGEISGTEPGEIAEG
jgi:hypothetical protein